MSSFIRHRGWVVFGIAVALFCIALVGTAVYLARRPVNPVNAALDRLAAVPLSQRWAHPEIATIREMGPGGVASLRRALREKESIRTRFLLWLGGRWRGVTNYVSDFPDVAKMQERRWAACQAIRELGAAARSAAPELVDMLRNADVSTGNAVTMALSSVGLDEEIAERLDQVLERGEGGATRSQIIYLLAAVRPPSERTRRVLESGLSGSTPWEQEAAASVIARLEVKTPPILERLKEIQRTATNQSLCFTASEALWVLEKRKEDVWLPTVTKLEQEVPHYDFKPFGGGSGGQGIDGPEMVYLKAANLWGRMELTPEEQKRALDVLELLCEKSGRIFIQMTLLPDRVKLGLPLEKAAEVCRAGLSAPEDYYRLQAARAVVMLCEKWKGEVPGKISVPGMMGHDDLGVRVAGAQVYWKTSGDKRQAELIVPVLVDALNAKKHQSYYYPEIQRTALQLLGELGTEGRAALDPLRELEKDVNPDIAKLAKDARQKVEAR